MTMLTEHSASFKEFVKYTYHFRHFPQADSDNKKIGWCTRCLALVQQTSKENMHNSHAQSMSREKDKRGLLWSQWWGGWVGVHRVGPELWRGGVVGFEHGTAQHGTSHHITAHHSTPQHSTTYSIAQHIAAQHSTTQPLRPPKRASLPPSLPPSPPSLPPTLSFPCLYG